ncbi:ribosomal-processing cysteine protease Prp [Lachnospiraceae bacterium ZAX-1]
MVKVTIYKGQADIYAGFDCTGHADYAEKGSDIICAGVSALVINTINSISCLTDDVATTDSNEKTGRISMKFEKQASYDANLLIKSLILGLQGIQKNYGNEYIMLIFKEV